MKNSFIKYGIVFLIGMVTMFFLKSCNKEVIEVPITIEVPVPIKENKFDTILKPYPVKKVIKEIDTTLLNKYKKANDSLKKKLFKESIEVRDYKEVFEDSVQKITVSANVTGTLNSLSAEYKTKPSSVIIDTTLNVKTNKKRWSISPYAEIGVPTNVVYPDLVFKAGLDYTNKNNIIYGASYDSQGRVWGKIGLKF